MSGKIYPVILSGGSGSRLWPLSRESYPKQLLPLAGPRTMLQETALRVADAKRFHPVMVVANAEHRFVIAEQLREAGAAAPTIVLEPAARNTAAAVASAALLTSSEDSDAVILVMPADHTIPARADFLAAIEAGLPAAREGALVLFGIQPDTPATGYGYIRGGEALSGAARKVEAFVEKPDLATAEAYLESGDYYWNSGIFLLPARAVLEELERHEPQVLAAVQAAVAAATRDMDFLRLDPETFSACPSISIDYAVMERTARAAVVPSSFVWSDVGAWSALWELADRDGDDNVEIGDTLAENTRGSYLRSEGPLIATVGVEDLIVIATPDAVLVASRHADQHVKRVVERLKASNHATAVQTRRVYRPWGWYEGIHVGERFQVKRITVNPGGKLSLQKHFHRAEHWVVVNGTAEVHLDGVQTLLGENESIYIPLGATHRLCNPGKVPLNLIEVQSGAYLGEDDIVRLEDVYARG
ncbi:mannose-1-phosphate guanylyltransferase/mannose-6-phosphate isomerase [Phenylobacterium sp.]|uniref:mannose-1-phosphate guanylyltransferase/mannose-6-phosphate isomerase n=1 Tax=Phenylobacterium sp. TaxID=1871053 RepID=UPI002B9A4039|nr:mannose-1-phosphate guanylyltransferase/mannose-6-phosphate isomerase [Phenylobacterium sp.]HVI33722.1 mannose-1-phosphate guanylyltransferase/mannose-6-phosphate isomerase [Phenylobacterium sp.]